MIHSLLCYNNNMFFNNIIYSLTATVFTGLRARAIWHVLVLFKLDNVHTCVPSCTSYCSRVQHLTKNFFYNKSPYITVFPIQNDMRVKKKIKCFLTIAMSSLYKFKHAVCELSSYLYYILLRESFPSREDITYCCTVTIIIFYQRPNHRLSFCRISMRCKKVVMTYLKRIAGGGPLRNFIERSEPARRDATVPLTKVYDPTQERNTAYLKTTILHLFFIFRFKI